MVEKTTSLTPSEAAQKLGVTLDYVYRELWSGRFASATKTDGRWKIPAQAVNRRLEGRKS